MDNPTLFVSSHAPYWHNGARLSVKNCHIMIAALPAVIMGIYQYGRRPSEWWLYPWQRP